MEETPSPKPAKLVRAPRAVKASKPLPSSDRAKSISSHEVVREPKRPSGRTYYTGAGRRKEAIAFVRLYAAGHGNVIVAEKPLLNRFPTAVLQQRILSPLKAVGQEGMVDLSIHVSGGGVRGQADAIALAISRALLKLNPLFRKALKSEGLLRRDARVKERKKYGLKRARRAPQFSKR